MTPRKPTSYNANTSKGEPDNRDLGNTKVPIIGALEESVFTALGVEVVASGNESSVPTEGKFLQMLASMQRQLDEQQVQVDRKRKQTSHKCEAAALEREAATCINYQILSHIGVFRRA